MELSEEYHAVMRQFEERFGEGAPMMMMPGRPEAVIDLLRECLEEGSTEPIDRQFPPGVVI